jgi:Lon protease-like protein
MDEDLDLSDSPRVCRLFPLPRVVLFPHAVLPLHIFEPRYKQMTEDALASDSLVTIVQWRAPAPSQVVGEPPIEDVACLGRILEHERLPDGQFNFLLLGRKRVRLIREIPSPKLYRLAEAEILEDEETELPEEPSRAELIALFCQAIKGNQNLEPDLADLLKSGVPLGVLTDIVAHSLSLPSRIKQLLLAETKVDRRVERLRQILREVAGEDPTPVPEDESRLFPPPFSVN